MKSHLIILLIIGAYAVDGFSSQCKDTYTKRTVSRLERARAHIKAPFVWTAGITQNIGLIYNVYDLIKFRPMKGGLIDMEHPWVTGINPENFRFNWVQNIVFQSPRAGLASPSDDGPSDEEIVEKLGKFLAKMVASSAKTSSHPHGLTKFNERGAMVRRMPHAINYIHGAAHYNSGWIIFNDFAEAYTYFNQREFRQELRKFVKEQKREVTIVFRDKNYEPKEFGDFAGMLRSALPWYSNVNGPNTPVHWGSRAPYPVINMITGHFVTDLKNLVNPDTRPLAVRPALVSGKYFQQDFRPSPKVKARPLEKLFSWWVNQRVRFRPSNLGNLFFVNKKKMDAAKKRTRIRQVEDLETGRSWPLYRTYFNDQHIEINDYSSQDLAQEGKVMLPGDYDPATEVVISFMPDGTYHSFIVAGKSRSHGTLLFRNRARITTNDGNNSIRAVSFVRLKGFTVEQIDNLSGFMNDSKNTRSLSCANFNYWLLREGLGIRFASAPKNPYSIAEFYRTVLSSGFVDQRGQAIPMDVYHVDPDKTPDDHYLKMKMTMDYKWGILGHVARWIVLGSKPAAEHVKDHFLLYEPPEGVD